MCPEYITVPSRNSKVGSCWYTLLNSLGKFWQSLMVTYRTYQKKEVMANVSISTAAALDKDRYLMVDETLKNRVIGNT